VTVTDKKNKSKREPEHGRTHGHQPSYAIPVWNGILDHREKIGPALWEFLWCLDKITVEDEHGIGWCLGKTPIDTKRIAAELREHPDTAYQNMERLAVEGYVVRKRTPRGYIVGVLNSRKFGVFRSKSDSGKTPNHSQSDSGKTLNHDSEKTPNQSPSDSGKTPNQTPAVIQGFPESDSDKTPSRRDFTGTIQESTSKERAPLRSAARSARTLQTQPHTPAEQVRLNFYRLAREFGWGYRDILGFLRERFQAETTLDLSDIDFDLLVAHVKTSPPGTGPAFQTQNVTAHTVHVPVH
jgi:hypothetical protein